MKVKNIILTALLACMLYPSGQAMKRKREDTEQQRDAKKTRGWQSLTPSSICNSFTNIIRRFLGRNRDTNDYFSNLSYDELIHILSQLAKSYDLSTPQGIIDAIKFISSLKRINPRFNNLLTPQEIGHILRNAGADVNATINNPGNYFHGFTALHFAARRGHTAAIQALVAAGANVHATINNPEYIHHDWTVLHLDADLDHTAAIQDPGHDYHGMTAMHLAARLGHADAIQALVGAIQYPEQRVAFVNTTINNPGQWEHGMTALHLAAYNGHTNAIQALIAAVPDPEQKAAFVNATIHNPGHVYHNRTALYFAAAAWFGTDDAIHALLAAGADVPVLRENLLQRLRKLGVNLKGFLNAFLERLELELVIDVPENQIVH